MKKALLSMVVMAVPILADSIPAGWVALKDPKGVCQIGVPGNFKPDPNFPGLAKGPGDTMEVQALSSAAPVKPVSDMVAKMMNIEKVVENTPQRVLYQEKPNKVADGRTMTGWTVKVPRGTGNCSAAITVVPGGQEDLVKKIASTLAPGK